MTPAETETHPTETLTSEPSSGARLVATDGRALPLRAAALRGDARGGLARVVLEQRFENPHDEPLAVTYSLPMPADGAVAGFVFTVGDRRIVGEVDRRQAARERFEQAVASGRTAALLEQDRSSLFTQEVGNVPPRAAVVCEVTIDQPLRWLDEGQWEWRFPTTVAPRYLGAPGRVPDAARVTQEIADGPLPVRLALALAVRDPLPGGVRPASPSHGLHTEALPGRCAVAFAADGGVPLDRDVVVRWTVATPEVGVGLDAARRRGARDAYGLLTIVPPRAEGRGRPVPRDLCVLLDTSGSMGGEPLDQARRIVSALVSSLTDADQLELIEFSTAPRRWKRGPARATAGARKEALAWLAALRASGGTEMRHAIYDALAPLRGESQRQVVLVTDGLIGFESEVVATVLEKLPAGSRLHTVGVGSSVNRSLTGPAARAGRGLEVVVGLGEDPERASARLLARTAAPLVVDLELAGRALAGQAPSRLPDLFAGAPALVAVKLAEGGGELRVRGRTAAGPFERRLRVEPVAEGTGSEAVVTHFGRESVEDLEMRLAGGAARREIDAAIEALGLELRIATRLTSWVAATEEATVDPTAPTRRERVPHALPYGTSMAGLGLRAPGSGGAVPMLAAGLATFGRAPMAGRIGAPLAAPAPAKAAFAEPASFDDGVADELAAEPTGAWGSPAPAAPPSPTSPAKRGGGLVRGLVERLRGVAGAGAARGAAGEKTKDEAAPAPPPRPGSEGALKVTKAGGSPRRLRGHVLSRQGRKLLVEVEVDGAVLAWRPEGPVRVLFAGGIEVTATLDLGATTRAGELGPGLRLRLALELDADGTGAPSFIAVADLLVELAA